MNQGQSEPGTGGREPIRLDRAGSTLHAWQIGPEDAPMVVFIHGGWMDHHMFDDQIGPVLDVGHQILVWDLRGHGQSRPRGIPEPSVADMAADLLALLDELGHTSPVFLVGQSLGGMVAQEVALAEEGRVAGLVTIGAPCTTLSSQRIRMSMSTLWSLSGGLAGLLPIRVLRQQMVEGLAVRPEVQDYVRTSTENITKGEFRWLVRASRGAGRHEPGYRIGVAVLIVRGEHDQSGAGRMTALTAPHWLRRDPDIRYEVIPDAGHQAHQDQPEVFNQLLVAFLQGRQHT